MKKTIRTFVSASFHGRFEIIRRKNNSRGRNYFEQKSNINAQSDRQMALRQMGEAGAGQVKIAHAQGVPLNG